jgi:hypothetical protein
MQDLTGIDESKSDLTIDEVMSFIEEVKRHKKIRKVIIVGGEPFIHPNLGKICDLLKNELLDSGIIKKLWIYHNNTINHNREYRGIPCYTMINPDRKHEVHRCSFASPLDTNQKVLTTCGIHHLNGICRNKYGYFPCGTGAYIVRLFQYGDLIKDNLPASIDEFVDYDRMCQQCQASAADQMLERQFNRLISSSFEIAINKLKRHYLSK